MIFSMQIGCIHFAGSAGSAPTDIKVILVIYHPGKGMFMGFIPNDQPNFFAAFKENINKQKQHHHEQQVRSKQVKRGSRVERESV